MGPDSPSKMSEDHSSHKLFQVFFSDIFAFRPFKSQPATIQWQKHLTFCCNVLIVGGTHVPLPFDAGFALKLEQWGQNIANVKQYKMTPHLYMRFFSRQFGFLVCPVFIWDFWLFLVFLWYDLFAFLGVVLFLGRTCGLVFFLCLTRVCVFFSVFSLRYDLQGLGASSWYEDETGILILASKCNG